MVFPFKALAFATGIAVLLGPTAASAEIRRVSFIGTIVDGVDETGVFGTPGSLDGESFTATYAYDTLSFRATVPGVSDVIEPVAPTLRVKGVTHVFPLDNILLSDVLAGVGQLSVRHYTVDFSAIDEQFIDNTALSALLAPDLDPASGGTFAVSGGGSFHIFACCDTYVDTSGWFDVDFVRFGVPEPATWALMISGFGVAGAALRRRGRFLSRQ